MNNKKIALVVGVGPGTGTHLVKRFAKEGYRVAMLARNNERLQQLETEVADSKGFVCDVSNLDQLKSVMATIKQQWGVPDVVVHNALAAVFGDFMQIEPEQLERNFQVNTMGLLYLGQILGPDFVQRGHGVILCTGNTSAYRGKANFAGFAPTKAAQRILAESMARRLGPEGIHVAYITIDAVIDLPWTRKMFPDAADDFFCQPADIAAECVRIAQQPRSAWSFHVEIRPFGENW